MLQLCVSLADSFKEKYYTHSQWQAVGNSTDGLLEADVMQTYNLSNKSEMLAAVRCPEGKEGKKLINLTTDLVRPATDCDN